MTRIYLPPELREKFAAEGARGGSMGKGKRSMRKITAAKKNLKKANAARGVGIP